jgi:hypothetical protein
MSDTTPKLQFVRLHLGKQRMDVIVYDPVIDARRLIRYEWSTKEPSDLPPEGWHEGVLGEVQYQRSQEHKKRSGRFIPGG